MEIASWPNLARVPMENHCDRIKLFLPEISFFCVWIESVYFLLSFCFLLSSLGNNLFFVSMQMCNVTTIDLIKTDDRNRWQFVFQRIVEPFASLPLLDYVVAKCRCRLLLHHNSDFFPWRRRVTTRRTIDLRRRTIRTFTDEDNLVLFSYTVEIG